MSGICYVNGTFCESAEARISIFDRGLLFGDAIYEVVRVHGGRLFRVDDHYARMSGGLAEIGVAVPFSAAEFRALLRDLVGRNRLQSGLAYAEVTRGAADMRTHLSPSGLRPTVIAFVQSAELPVWPEKFPGGVSAMSLPDIRWQRCNLKTTMLLPNVLTKEQAHESGVYEGLFISPDSVVREGCSTNVFAVIDGALRTHPADRHILRGITGRVVLELARAAGIPVREEAFTLSELLGAREAFLTATTIDVCPLVRVDGRTLGDGRIGPVTRRLIDAMARALKDAP